MIHTHNEPLPEQATSEPQETQQTARPLLSGELGDIAMPGKMYLHHDDVSDRLDEMADLCEHWKRWREGRNYTPQAIRCALVMLSREVASLADWEQANGPRVEPI